MMWLGLFFLAIAALPLTMVWTLWGVMKDETEMRAAGADNTLGKVGTIGAIAVCLMAATTSLAAAFMAFTGLGT